MKDYKINNAVFEVTQNLKCCGNCGNSASCGTQKKLCDLWVWDGKTEKERMNK